MGQAFFGPCRPEAACSNCKVDLRQSSTAVDRDCSSSLGLDRPSSGVGVRCRPWWEVFQAVLVFGRWLLVISLVLGRWALGVTSEVGLRSASFSALSSSRCKKRPSDHCPVTPNYRTRNTSHEVHPGVPKTLQKDLKSLFCLFQDVGVQTSRSWPPDPSASPPSGAGSRAADLRAALNGELFQC